jgi:hypothetical protein
MPVTSCAEKMARRSTRWWPSTGTLRVKDFVGLWEDGEERDQRTTATTEDFAVALCRRGFMVAAPEITCFGERRRTIHT